MSASDHSWGWIFWDVLIRAGNPRGAKHWARVKLMDKGWIKGEQRCPRRGESVYGLQDKAELPDWWRVNPWGWGPWRRFVYWWRMGPIGAGARRIRDWGWNVQTKRDFDRLGAAARWIAERFNWLQGGTTWQHPWQPRTCSYCGGAHPEDILRLLGEDWEVEPTDKSYKRYMHPKRSGVRTVLAGQGCRGHEIPVHPWHAVPPVKLYVHHFNADQVERFNAQLEARNVRKS